MAWMFDGCSSLTSLDLSNFDTSNAITMNAMFQNCSRLESLDLSNFNTKNILYFGWMFYNCSKLTSLDVSNFDTKNALDMRSMFNKCSKITSLDVSNFDTSNTKAMSCMFFKCSSLKSIDVSNFNTSNVKDMSSMFELCSGLTTIDVSNLDTSKVTDMSFMFGCGLDNYVSQLKEIKGLENFNTSNVKTMECMFIHQINLEKLNLSSFDTSNVQNMDGMFCALNIEKIYVSNKWNTSKVTKSNYMFGEKIYIDRKGKTYNYVGVNEQRELTGGNGTKWDAEHIDKEYARIDTAVYENGNYVSGDKGYFSILPGE